MKVDYNKVAHNYDKHRRGGGPYLDRLVSLARDCSARRVLELGAGTGNNTQVFLEEYPCTLTGLDLSRAMLDRARAKAIRASWVNASATSLPFANGYAQFLFGVYVLHHIPNLDTLFAECARVIDHGYAAFVTASTDYIERHPMNRYFPSYAAVDKARFQPIDQILEEFGRAGFACAGHEVFADKPRPIEREYLSRIADKFVSTFDLLPPDEYAAGLARMTSEIEKNGRLDIEFVWESVVVWGRKG